MRWRPRTLRGRVTAVSVLVLLVGTALAGLVSTLALRHGLLARLDDQLRVASARFTTVVSDGDADDVVPGQPVGTLGLTLVRGRAVQVQAVGIDGRVRAATLGAADLRRLTAVPVGVAVTVHLDVLDDYRVLAVARGDVEQVTGLPQEDLDATLADQAGVEAGLFVAVIAGGAAATALLVRRTLRPLAAMAATARRVTALQLTEPSTEVPSGPEPSYGATEVDSLGRAFDTLLAHVRDALATRDATEARLRQFVSDAGHELRTPLAAVTLHTDLATRGRHDLPRPTVAHLDRVDAAAARMTSLVEDLLLLARLDAHTAAPHVAVDLARIVVEAVTEAQPLAPDHHWCLELPDDEVQVLGDARQLHQAVANLVGNAHAHTPAGTTITVSLELVDTAIDGRRPAATVRVDDDGPGIPAELVPTVFDRFTRGDAARSRGHGSSGLGLAITRTVAEAHRGHVALDTGPGYTHFALRLPAFR